VWPLITAQTNTIPLLLNDKRLVVRGRKMPSPSSPTAERSSLSAARRVAVALLVSLSLGLVASTTSADNTAQQQRDVTAANDFRVRVASALALGKKKDPSSIPALTQALSDSNPAVRSSAAAALGSIADPRSLPALEQAMSAEKDGGAKRAMGVAVRQVKANSATKYIVTIGRLENKSGNPKVDQTFRSVARAEIARLPNVEVADTEQAGVAKAKEKQLPTIALDGRLVTLSKANVGGDVGFAARVEFVVRKIPEQSLKATINGNAKALASSGQVTTPKQIADLQGDAVEAAVQSALSGAPTALAAAAK